MVDVKDRVGFYWDAIIVAGRTPGFFELKRTRETGPLFGQRLEI